MSIRLWDSLKGKLADGNATYKDIVGLYKAVLDDFIRSPHYTRRHTETQIYPGVYAATENSKYNMETTVLLRSLAAFITFYQRIRVSFLTNLQKLAEGLPPSLSPPQLELVKDNFEGSLDANDKRDKVAYRKFITTLRTREVPVKIFAVSFNKMFFAPKKSGGMETHLLALLGFGAVVAILIGLAVFFLVAKFSTLDDIWSAVIGAASGLAASAVIAYNQSKKTSQAD